MKNLIRLVAVVSNAFLLIACSPPMPDLDLDSNRTAANKQHFKWAERKPLRKIKLAGDFFMSKELEYNLPRDKAAMPVSIKFPNRTASLGDIVFLLEQKNIPVSYNWTVYEDSVISSSSSSDSSNEDTDVGFNFGEEKVVSSNNNSSDNGIEAINVLERRIVPFKTYEGTLKGLMDRIKKSMNIAYWWEDGTLYLSTNQEYVVSVPQQQDIISSVVSEIEALGATDTTSSLTAGQIVYYAKPRAQSNLIKPFLKRISHNLSEITLQVALVQVEVKEAKSEGFDWNAFNVEFGAPSIAGGPDYNTSGVVISPYNGDSANPVGEVSGSFFRKGLSIFGTETDVDIDLAINILSTIGKTTTEQNVEMRTISGKEVTMESVREESYISGYSGGSYGDNPEPPSPEFDTVETGLSLTFLPVFDAYNAIVTIDTSISMSNRLADTKVDAGGDFGEVSVRPNIKKDTLEDIVRIPVGETVILGGLTNETLDDRRTAPMGAWDVNSAKKQSNKQALFLIIRPLVTLYETGGNETNIKDSYMEDQIKYNYDKATEKKEEDIKKAKEDAEKKQADELAAARANVQEKARKLEAERVKKEAEETRVAEELAEAKRDIEKQYKNELLAKEKEAAKLREEVEEQKKIRAVLEAEDDWKNEINLDEEAFEEIKVEEVTQTLSDDEIAKIELLNRLRGIKN